MRLPSYLKNFPDSQLRTLIFACFVLFVIVHQLFNFLGFYGMDDINYARYAARVASGEISLKAESHRELRWACIYITAFFYKLFGINDYTTRAYGFLTIVLSGYLIRLLLSKSSIRAYLLALALFFLNYKVFFSTHRIWPDTAVCLFTLSGFYFYIKAREEKNQMIYGLLFGLSFFLVMLSKETVVLLLPFVFYFGGRDILKSRIRSFWMSSFISSCMLFFLYLLSFKIYTGDWFYRYHILQANAYFDVCNFDKLPFIETLKRVGYLLWNSFLIDGGLLSLIPAFCAFIYRKKLDLNDRNKLVVSAFFVLLLSSNFMTISYKSYIPLCQDPRHFMFLFPFAAICGSLLLNKYAIQPKYFTALPVMMWAATILIFTIGAGEIKYVYLILSIALLLPFIKVKMSYSRVIIFCSIISCFLLRPLFDFVSPHKYEYLNHKRLITTFFGGKQNNAIVFTGDDLTAEISEYFMKFDTTVVRFKNLARTDDLNISKASNAFILINEAYHPTLQVELKKLYDADKINFLEIKKCGRIILYEVREPSILNSFKKYTSLRFY